jgi:hypothetical protein
MVPVRRLCVLLFAAAWVAGCGREEPITSYSVPRQTDPGPRPQPYRILGAMYPADNPVWFFKFTGGTEDLTKHEAEFDALARSVKLQGEQPPTFDLPAEWVNIGPRTSMRMGIEVRFEAVLKVGGRESPLEVTLSKSGGGVAANAGRWADQVGAEYDADHPGTVFDAAGVKGLRVDFRGPKNPAGGPMLGKMR